MPSPGIRIGRDNREAVREYFRSHVGCTRIECGKALGLSVECVGRHIYVLRTEWLDSENSGL